MPASFPSHLHDEAVLMEDDARIKRMFRSGIKEVEDGLLSLGLPPEKVPAHGVLAQLSAEVDWQAIMDDIWLLTPLSAGRIQALLAMGNHTFGHHHGRTPVLAYGQDVNRTMAALTSSGPWLSRGAQLAQREDMGQSLGINFGRSRPARSATAAGLVEVAPSAAFFVQLQAVMDEADTALSAWLFERT